MLDFPSIFIIYMIITHKTSKVPFLNLKKCSLIHKGIHFKCYILLFNVAETICSRDLYSLSTQVKKILLYLKKSNKIQGNDQALQNLLCLICAL